MIMKQLKRPWMDVFHTNLGVTATNLTKCVHPHIHLSILAAVLRNHSVDVLCCLSSHFILWKKRFPQIPYFLFYFYSLDDLLRIFSASCVSSSCEREAASPPLLLVHLAWTMLLICSRLLISSSKQGCSDLMINENS